MVTLELPVRFENLTYSLAGILLGAIGIILFYLSHKRLRIADKHLEQIEWRKLRRIIRIINISTKTSIVIALSFLLATPYLPTTIEVPVEKATEEQMAQYATTIMLLMDVSYSMNNSDLKPTRLEVSKTLATLLVNKISPADLVGFVSFAGQIYDTVIPTKERTIITQKIDNQTLHSSTAIGIALETAIGVLETFPSGGEAIVLFSDGKNNIGVNVESAADEAIAMNIPIFTVSLGTYGLGEADPLALSELSSKTGGKFYEVRNEAIDSLATSVSQISREVKVSALKTVYDKLIIAGRDYQTPRVVFSALLVAALFLSWSTGV